VLEVLAQIKDCTRRAVGDLQEAYDALGVDARLSELGVANIVDALAADFRRRMPATSVRVALPGGDELEDVGPAVREAVYVVVHEALANASAHAAPATVTVQVHADRDALVVIVEDDGRGFDPDLAAAGGGLERMRVHAGIAGAQIAIRSDPASGTALTLQVARTAPPMVRPTPLAAAAPASAGG
jgi:signal transduction histidine kinase